VDIREKVKYVACIYKVDKVKNDMRVMNEKAMVQNKQDKRGRV
jgi:hypothetical protein